MEFVSSDEDDLVEIEFKDYGEEEPDERYIIYRMLAGKTSSKHKTIEFCIIFGVWFMLLGITLLVLELLGYIVEQGQLVNPPNENTEGLSGVFFSLLLVFSIFGVWVTLLSTKHIYKCYTKYTREQKRKKYTPD